MAAYPQRQRHQLTGCTCSCLQLKGLPWFPQGSIRWICTEFHASEVQHQVVAALQGHQICPEHREVVVPDQTSSAETLVFRTSSTSSVGKQTFIFQFETSHNNKFHQVLFFQQTLDLINFIPWSFYLNVSSFPWCLPCLLINTFAIIGSVIQVIILVELDTWACWFHTVVPLPKQQTCIMLSIYQVPSPALAVQKLDCLSLCMFVFRWDRLLWSDKRWRMLHLRFDQSLPAPPESEWKALRRCVKK